jgi:DNA primase
MLQDDALLTGVLSRLNSVKGPDSGGRYTALCLFHNDRKRPNLRVNQQGYRCMACGAKGSLRKLAEEVGMATEQDAFGDRIEAVYNYCDEKGRLLFQVVRLCDPKDFRQRRPDGKGGWIWNLKGVRRVPYRLPELLGADPEELIFVVEGEKDVESLRRLGLVATTNPGGAGKWRHEYRRYLAGRKVVILPDNDDAGRAHAEEVARCLTA